MKNLIVCVFFGICCLFANGHQEGFEVVVVDAYSSALSVSGNGDTVVGYSLSSEGRRPFFWRQENGVSFLDEWDIGDEAIPVISAVSYNGSVAVGPWSPHPLPNFGAQAIRWTQEGGIVELNSSDQSNTYSAASAVSADGSVIVGHGNFNSQDLVAFRWDKDSGMVGLDRLDDGFHSSAATDVSANGEIVVGYGVTENSGFSEAFRWTARSGMVALGFLEGFSGSKGTAISANGRVIVGHSSSFKTDQAFRWTHETGMLGLGYVNSLLPDGEEFFKSYANDVNADGSVIVGSYLGFIAIDTPIQEAFRWTETTGIQKISKWLADCGVFVSSDFQLLEATGISDDGNVVVGYGQPSELHTSEAWIARGTSGLITVDEFTESFGTTVSVPQAALSLPTTVMNGAHHHVLLKQNFLDDDQMIWTTGDFANHRHRDADILIGEVGFAHDFNRNLLGGIGVGYGQVDQDLTFNGSHNLGGHYLLVELDYQIPETSVILSVTGIYGDWDAVIRRGYLNGGLPDSSRGATVVNTYSGRLRIDWGDAFNIMGFEFTPRGAFTLTQIETGAYTETGGGFPASFSGMSHTAEEIRLGLTGEKALSDRATLRGIFEAVYRLDKSHDGFSGEVIGLFDFAIPGAKNRQRWVRGGLEGSYRLSNSTLITGTVFGATRGEDPEVTASLNLQWLF